MSFLNHDKAIITSMVQADNPDRIKYLIDESAKQGAEAFGMQFEQMKSEYRIPEVYKSLFNHANGKPVYVTNYRSRQNEGKTDEILAEELIELAENGATLCDVMGDYFDKQPGELTMNEDAIKKQMELIDKLHQKGAEVLMSSHVQRQAQSGKEFVFLPSEHVLEIAMEHQRRGADISKIVIKANTMEEQLENLKTINLLKENLKIPFLFLCGGECKILRKIGGELGNCMYLCVSEYDELATKVQPLIKNVKTIKENM